jgi:hypothetical protein
MNNKILQQKKKIITNHKQVQHLSTCGRAHRQTTKSVSVKSPLTRANFSMTEEISARLPAIHIDLALTPAQQALMLARYSDFI